MSDNVIYVDFDKDDGTGYLMEKQRDGKSKITGVYVDDLSAFTVDGDVHIGEKNR